VPSAATPVPSREPTVPASSVPAASPAPDTAPSAPGDPDADLLAQLHEQARTVAREARRAEAARRAGQAASALSGPEVPAPARLVGMVAPPLLATP
jgi:hypothetical protein